MLISTTLIRAHWSRCAARGASTTPKVRGSRCRASTPRSSGRRDRQTDSMTDGTQHPSDDPRNAEILIWVNGELLPRDRAVVSVFDSGFVLGDGVWEGLRVSGGHPAFLEQHLDRLEEGARAIMLDLGLTREQLTDGGLRDAARQRDDRRRARAADGDARGEVDALPGPAGDDRPRDGGDHRRAQGAVAGDRDRRHHPLHHARAPRRRRTPSTRSSTRTASSTTSRPASRPTRPAPTRR